MRVGIPVRNGHIFGHFGQANTFLLVDVEDGQVTNQIEVDASHTGGHGANVTFLKEQGITHLIVMNIGPGARGHFNEEGITVISGAKGDPVEAVLALANGTLVDDEKECDHGSGGHHHHHHGHDHGHHHHD